MNRKRLDWHWQKSWLLAGSVFAVGMGLLSLAMRAEDSAGRAARLSLVEGKVRIAQGSQLLADPALQNTPLFEGTQVLTSDDGKAELQLDDGSVVRVSPNSSLTISVLRGRSDSGEAEMTLENGLAYFELHNDSAAGPIRVRFGDSVVTASGFTVMRVNLDNPPGELAVFSGNAHLESGHALQLDLHGGESVALNGAKPDQSNVDEVMEPDSWDAWNADRDQVLTSAETARTGAANNMPDKNNPAWSDLDANGNWYNVPSQGYVWSPYGATNAGWDPYGNGHWMWTPGFGYIWISGDPWGYLPFQCGAWNFYNDFGWGWAPGTCQPWWGGGAGWLSNIGFAPGGYQPPRRPIGGPPHRPIPLPIHGRFHDIANPVVVVNRRPPGGTGGAAVGSPNAIATINGNRVTPLQPVAKRPLDGSTSGYVNSPSRAVSTGAMTPLVQSPTSGANSGGAHSTSAPARPVVVQHPPVASGPAVSSRPAPAAPPPSPPASRATSGGGGGSHASGGSTHR